jgi:hypothetical protein
MPFEVGFLAGPALEVASDPAVGMHCSHRRLLACREEAARHLRHGKVVLDALDVNADLTAAGDGVQGNAL